MKAYLTGGLVLALLATGAGWWHATSERLRAEGRAELHLARADSMQAQADAKRQHATLQRRRADSLAVALDSVRAETERRVARERARRPEIVERIVHAPDTAAIREAVADLEGSHEAEMRGLRTVLAAADSALALERARVETLSAEVAQLRQVNASLRAAIGDTRVPGFLETWGGRVLWAGAGAVVGYVAGR